jgi:hypothetical protein
MFSFIRKLFASQAQPRYTSMNMIPITSDIIGPGIEEEYADALARIDRILEILHDVEPSNGTFKARVVANCAWLRPMILERTMPIPLDRSYWSTLAYVTGDMTFAAEIPELSQAIADVVNILKGNGLLKDRHYPVVVALIRDLIDVMQRDIPSKSEDEKSAIVELGDAIRWIDHHKARLPLDKSQFPHVRGLFRNDKFAPNTPLLFALFKMSAPTFAGERPRECIKGELKAPVPGLPATPPRVR